MADFLTAAYRVLVAVGRPLSAQDLARTAIREGLLVTRGQTPGQTMKSKLSTDILSKRDRSRFMRVAKGRFALRSWTQHEEHVADRYQKALFDEDIVVIPRETLAKYIPGPGLHRPRIDYDRLRVDSTPMRRREAEQTFDVVQLVSQFVVRHGSDYLTHKRTKRLPENRLHGFYSIAFGGHLNPDDLPTLFDISDPQQSYGFLMRELGEELKLLSGNIGKVTYRGLLYDDSREVSTQHMGIVFEVTLRTPAYRIGERGFLMDAKFESLQDIARRLDDFENWSALIVRTELAAVESEHETR